MICKRCGKKQATVYYKQTINGESKEYALCDECAAELTKKGEIDLQVPSLFDEYEDETGLFGLGGLFGLPYNITKKPSEKKKCPFCASTFDDLVKRGKIGCAECYKTFENELRRTVEELHGKEKYIGRMPKKFKKIQTKEDRIAKLKSEMKEAVKKQEFERAAVLRDEIKAVEEGGEQ